MIFSGYLDVPGQKLGSMGYNLLIDGIYWGYNPLTHIQVDLLSQSDFLWPSLEGYPVWSDLG